MDPIIQKIRPLILNIFISLIIYIFLIVLFQFKNISPLLIIRDLSQTCDFSIGVGLVSTIGIILWFTTASVLTFSLLIKKVSSDFVK